MADFINCDRSAFGFETILASMFSTLDSDTQIMGFRVKVYNDTYATPAVCGRYDTWKDMFKKSLELGTDGFATLRVILSSDAHSIAPSCGSWEDTEYLLLKSFVELRTGEIAMLLFAEGS